MTGAFAPALPVGVALIAAGTFMVLVADRAQRSGSSWLTRSRANEVVYALAAGALVTGGLFMALPSPA
ncbi:MAG: hypothetical protein DI565_18105 [Ancylobacter novellus]|uniref:Uncharacterized protein n=1 Tax=Ancylobacter novellus TaxID=921 RepID=A0A2W5LV68_ANCNO|nr:MAG: hypothetical protein DI565_18105 [Ancylobacter novellus]